MARIRWTILDVDEEQSIGKEVIPITNGLFAEAVKTLLPEARKEAIDIWIKYALSNPNLTPEQQKDILDRQMEIFNAVDKKDTEIREHEMEMARMADKKDTEKKEFNWKVLGAASFVVLTAVGIGTATLGGKFDFKLPKKS